ncbi:GNAT family N-acetyltransferase [Xanthomonas arboricola]|uniref:GNAT family N-acetyltransferase n=1 Tax=Xanthomonas arboricola TaxID=56448 RepID=UPI00142FC9BC|nr:GNAT family N-acetyltransferase [Xanthomonas arboricola]NJB80290.1 GNAT superfamily N-acetyltransferase [Xanthomonas arboricola]
MIRAAHEDDLPAILAMSRKFYATTSYASMTPMDDHTVSDLVFQLMDSVMLVAELDGQVVGMVGLVVAPFMFNRNIRAAYEVVWWVEPEAQGAGVGKALLAAVEPACVARGASAVVMVHLATSPPQASALYERMGYALSETCYTKNLVPA